ncbi:MAG: hypothetical protein Q9168_006623, partial [Polycauliona sp. 1 TL-2023]
MPTERYFRKYPPFSSNVPVIDLACLSYTQLLANDEAESLKMFEACQNTGFFLINLAGSEEGDLMLKHAETAFDLNEQIHDLQMDELRQYPFKPPGSLYG